MKIIRRAALGALAALLALTLLGAPAHAAGMLTATETAAPAAPSIMFTLDPATVVQFLIAFILPVLVGLVTTRVTSPAIKAWLLAGLSVVTSLLVELGRSIATGTTYDLGVALLAALPAFVVSVASYYGLLKPTGITAAAQDVGVRDPAKMLRRDLRQ